MLSTMVHRTIKIIPSAYRISAGDTVLKKQIGKSLPCTPEPAFVFGRSCHELRMEHLRVPKSCLRDVELSVGYFDQVFVPVSASAAKRQAHAEKILDHLVIHDDEEAVERAFRRLRISCMKPLFENYL